MCVVGVRVGSGGCGWFYRKIPTWSVGCVWVVYEGSVNRVGFHLTWVWSSTGYDIQEIEPYTVHLNT